MEIVKQKIILICGPTSSGKSDVAIKLAKKFNGEIISADSRQVYRGMDIGSGKVPKDDSRDAEEFYSEGVKHYLIDVTDPQKEFNISHFKKLAEQAIEEILAKGKLPIICGGTGFWIQSLTSNIELPNVKPNHMLRSMLRNKSAEELFTQLEKLDPKRAAGIDKHNKVRLIRAIEIATELGKVPAKSLVISHQSSKYKFLQIGIEIERNILNEKIKKRLEMRFEQGMIEEVENLHSSGVSWERLEGFGLEYRWIARYLQNKIGLEEMKEKLFFDIIHYAKRQMTWFKKDQKILWLNEHEKIQSAVANFLNK